MAKITLELESNAPEALNRAINGMDNLRKGVSSFEQEAKGAFSNVTKETEQLTNKVKDSAQESVNASNKILTGKKKEAAEVALLKAQLADVLEYEKKLREIQTNTAPGKQRSELNKKIAETKFELKGIQAELKKAEEAEKALVPPVVSLKSQLKSLKEQISTSTDPAEMQRLVETASELEDKIGDTNAAVKAFAADSKAAVAKNLFGQIMSDIGNFDMKGASDKAKQFATVIKTISFKETIAGIKSFGSSMITVGNAIIRSPFFLIVGALVAIGIALKSVFDDIARGDQALKDNAAAMREITDATNDLVRANRDLAIENDLASGKLTKLNAERLKNQNNFKDAYLKVLEQQREAQKKLDEDLGTSEVYKAQGITKVWNMVTGVESRLQANRNSGFKNIEEQFGKQLEELRTQFRLNDEKARNEEKLEKERKAKELNDKLIQYQKEFMAALTDLRKKAIQAEADMANGEDRAARLKAIAEEELKLLRDTIEKKGKLVNRNFKFSAEQEAQFAVLQRQINEKYANDIVAIEIEKANRIAAAQKSQVDNDLKFLELQQRLRVAAVNGASMPAGEVSESRFELIKQRNLQIIQKQSLEEQLDIKINAIAAEANVQKIAAQNELLALYGKNDELSNIKRKNLEDSIVTIEANAKLETDVLVAETGAQIDAVSKEIEDSTAEINKKNGLIDWQKLLGLNDSEFAKLKEGLNKFRDELQNFSNALFAFQNQELDFQDEKLQKELDIIDKRREAREKDISGLEEQLAKETKLADDGLANNMDRIRSELQAKEAARQKDLADQKRIAEEQKRIQAEKKRLAKLQFAVDTALQASNLLTAVSEVFATYVYPLNAVMAALMLGSFAVAKVTAYKAINNTPVENFAKGVIDLDGPGTETSDSIPANLSKGESVMTAKETRENNELLWGIRKKDNKLIEVGIRALLENTGIVLGPEIAPELSKTKNDIRTAETKLLVVSNNDGVESRIDRMDSKLKTLVKQGNKSRTVLPDGRIIEQEGSVTRIIRKS
jgi:hypothetical protein